MESLSASQRAHVDAVALLFGRERWAGENLVAGMATLVRQSASLAVLGRQMIDELEGRGAANTGGATAVVYFGGMLDDLRAVAAVLHSGYPIQALGIVASLLESLALLPAYALDGGGAERFRTHHNEKKAHTATTTDGLSAFVEHLGAALVHPPAEVEALLKDLYRAASQAKHKNPFMLRGIVHNEAPTGVVVVRTGPSCGGLWQSLAHETLAHAMGVVLLAAVFFGRNHVPDSPTFREVESWAIEALGMLLEEPEILPSAEATAE